MHFRTGTDEANLGAGVNEGRDTALAADIQVPIGIAHRKIHRHEPVDPLDENPPDALERQPRRTVLLRARLQA